MIRYLIGILVMFLVATFVKSVMSMIGKTIQDEVADSLGGGEKKTTADAGPAGKMLRKCAVCGTFKPEGSMITVSESGHSVQYCSKDCQRRALSTAS